MTLAGRHVLLGVSGGIASYKACTLARRLAELGAAVDVVMTASAAEFVGPVTFEALTGRPVLTSLWDRNRSLAHIGLAQTPDLIVLAPATANLLARAAQGIADDVLTAVLLAASVPVLAAPAMNDAMYAHPATARNLDVLTERGWKFLGPEIGPLAEGPSDRPGRMSEPETIAAHVERMVRGATSKLRGRRVLVTAGPTRERIDPIRVITNRSSGRMGYALARAAFARGADVVLVTGPTTLVPPEGPHLVRVESTEELCEAVSRHIGDADLVLMAAAPADYRPQATAAAKHPRSSGPQTLELEGTVDILEATRAQRKPDGVFVGFAYETQDGLDRARAKRDRKGLDLIVLNVDAPDAGAEVDTNRVTLIGDKSADPLPLLGKDAVAERVLDAVEPRL